MSTIRLSPYINFQGRYREALAFYRQVLGSDLADSIVGTDGHPDYPPTVGDNMALALRGADKPRLTALFAALAQGGHIKMPFAKPSWGGGGNGEVGWLIDKFGINWTVTIESAI